MVEERNGESDDSAPSDLAGALVDARVGWGSSRWDDSEGDCWRDEGLHSHCQGQDEAPVVQQSWC